VEKNLLERKLEDAALRDREREELRARLSELQQTRLDADLARAEADRLRLRLYKAPVHSGTYATHSDSYHSELSTPSDNLASELQRIALQTEAQSAIVADQGGLTIATHGGARVSELLAASAGEAERFSQQARQLLELAEVTQFTLQDRDGNIVHYRFFAVGDQVLSVATIGQSLPEDAMLDRVVTATIQRLTDPRERAARILKSGAR
jgi:predicted regulator of Ras-like GTPase activity (Roadblock/LC7/MglB family)